MNKLPTRVHVIGICGVATSALAIAFHESGVKVSGSDKGFFPPVSTELEKHGVPFYAGWHPEKMIEGGAPEVIIVGTASGSQNPETLYAKEHNIRMYSFAEAIGEFFAKENSIVCVGTWGKTSSSSLLSHILDHAGFNPTYMFGGVSLSHESSARLTDSKWSVFEGDEYKSSPTDPTAKFFYYKPTHLLLTAVSWDHADLYPTEADYFATFDKLMNKMPQSGPNAGFVVACADHDGSAMTANIFNGKKIFYGKDGGRASERGSSYIYSKISQSQTGLDLVITYNCKEYAVHSPMLGAYQAENITGCFAMAHSLGITPEKIVEAIASFEGLKRRMEKRLESEVTIIDDIAHSPEKARSVLTTLRAIYEGKIIVIFEPNIGGRSRESAVKYDNAFKDADFVIIPRLTKLKIAEDEKEQPMDGPELTNVISKTRQDNRYTTTCIEDDMALVQYIISNTKKGDVVAFLGSHGFRGMIEETVNKLSK